MGQARQVSGEGPRVLVVGTGHGCRVHLPALRAAGFQVVGLVGQDPERTARRAEKNGVAAFTDLEQAIAETAAEAVTIASTPASHGRLALQALEHGCHVYCEKPFARDMAEALSLLAAAEREGVVHLLGNQFRALPERIVAARAIAESVIGEPRFLSLVQYAGLAADPDAPRPQWWFDREAGGGWLGASGSHMIDMVRSWLGDFSTLSASLSVVAERENVAEDSFAIRFELANGVQGVMQQTGAAWGPQAAMTRLAGSKGTLWIEGGEVWVADRDGTRRLPIPDELRLASVAPSDDPRQCFLHIELPPAQRLCEVWRAAIEGRGDTGHFATFADGVACMKVIDAIRCSSASRGSVVDIEAGG